MEPAVPKGKGQHKTVLFGINRANQYAEKLWTCGTYANDPLDCINPWRRCISPKIEFSKDDLPEPTWIHVVSWIKAYAVNVNIVSFTENDIHYRNSMYQTASLYMYN